MSLPRKNEFKQKLLLEGKDDVFVISQLWETRKGKNTFTFDRIDCDGKDNIPDELETYASSNDTKTIGIVIDADDNPTARWQKYQDLLKKIGYEVPKNPEVSGTIIEGNKRKPRIGLWLMPDNNVEGMLEDFVKYLIPNNDPLRAEADRILNEIEAKNLNLYNKDTSRAKAFVYTWLAWQKNTGANMSTAIKEKLLTPDSTLCQQFINWLDRLFNQQK